ncbi:MAG: hypothetical protein ACTSRW_12765 [Candidatus Helarchaeota archaeon]
MFHECFQQQHVFIMELNRKELEQCARRFFIKRTITIEMTDLFSCSSGLNS